MPAAQHPHSAVASDTSAIGRLQSWLARLELLYVKQSRILEGVPLLRYLSRKITADLTILEPETGFDTAFRIQFRTPYFHFPVAIEKAQVGSQAENALVDPAAFRFFDWQSWAHIDGRVEWLDTSRRTIAGLEHEFITGFRYAAPAVPPDAENLGLRLAEGVDDTARVLLNGTIERIRFEPSYWMLVPEETGYTPVAIKDAELMVLIVSLSEIGSGQQRIRARAIGRLEEWTRYRFSGKNGERSLLEFLRYVRDWGPLGMEPLFNGLKDVIESFGLADPEKVLYEFYADNWGVRNNWHGRLLAIKLLEVLATDKARVALGAIFEYVKNRDTREDEIRLIHSLIDRTQARQSISANTLQSA